MALRIAPQFLVEDLPRAIGYYCHTLGFEQNIDYQDFYASVIRDGAEIHLKCADGVPGEQKHRQDNDHVHAMIETEDIQNLFDELQSQAAQFRQALETQPWGTRDFQVLDPDGHVICFFQPSD